MECLPSSVRVRGRVQHYKARERIREERRGEERSEVEPPPPPPLCDDRAW